MDKLKHIRKPYEKPELVEFGRLEDLTLGSQYGSNDGSMGDSADGGS